MVVKLRNLLLHSQRLGTYAMMRNGENREALVFYTIWHWESLWGNGLDIDGIKKHSGSTISITLPILYTDQLTVVGVLQVRTELEILYY
jgi:hypothetical protein